MTNTGIRCMLVASKCDKPESQEIRARFHEQVRRNLATIAVAEVSVKTPETTKRHFFAMLHRVIASPKGEPGSNPHPQTLQPFPSVLLPLKPVLHAQRIDSINPYKIRISIPTATTLG